MITIYEPGETVFIHNGLGIIWADSAAVTEELNGLYELALTCPYGDRNVAVTKYLCEFYIIKAPTPAGYQPFRIYSVTKRLDGRITVNARHIFYDLLYNFADTVQVESVSGGSALQAILAAAAYPHPFTAYGGLNDLVSLSLANTNPVEAILGDDGLIETLQKGELFRDYFSIHVLEAMGADRGLVIRHRKNLTGLNIEFDVQSLATRVKPIGVNTDSDPLYLPETYIDSPLLGAYFMPVYAPLACGDVKAGGEAWPDTDAALAEMRKRTAAFYQAGGDKPAVNAKIDFVLLRDTTAYREFASLENIFLGDTARVIHEALGVNIEAKCIRYTYDCILKRYLTIELGNFRGDFAVGAGRQINRLESAVTTGVSQNLAGILSRLTALESQSAEQAL